MEWLLVKNLSLGVIEYHLMDEGLQKAILKYNTHQQAVRLHADDQYGIFFIERAGSFINRTLVKNEYGQEVGKLSFDKRNSHHGPIELDGKKFHYSFQNTPFAELLLYSSKDFSHPVASTALRSSDGQHEVVFTSVSNEEYSCLLVGLCWYHMLVAKERETTSPALIYGRV